MPDRVETDAAGIVTEIHDVGAKSTLKGRRTRHRPGTPQPLDTLPADWRELLTRWVRRNERCKWETLIRDAGPARVETAHSLLDWLLRAGWIKIEETREGGQWKPLWVIFPDSARLRFDLGLPDPVATERAWQAARQHAFADAAIHATLANLDGLPASRALARHALLIALDNWREQGRYGTRRDFALFARSDTKAITQAEWDWLDSQFDLADYGVERHAPMLLVRAPLSLITASGQIDLCASPDFTGLSVDTLATATHIVGSIAHWRMAENRTSFERVARAYGHQDAVIWLPGFAPGWWKQAVRHLLRLKPAPALIACDPDPAGLEIALDAASLWLAAGLPWQAWKMDAASIKALPRRKPLTERDRQHLATLRQLDLPDTLQALIQWMEAHGEKGEQEGLL